MERVTGFTEEQRRVLRAALEGGTVPACPICGGRLTVSDIEPRGDVPYVRRRGWLRCAACRRTTAIDLPGRRLEDDLGDAG